MSVTPRYMSKQKLSPDVHRTLLMTASIVKTTQMSTSRRMDRYMVGPPYNGLAVGNKKGLGTPYNTVSPENTMPRESSQSHTITPSVIPRL